MVDQAEFKRLTGIIVTLARAIRNGDEDATATTFNNALAEPTSFTLRWTIAALAAIVGNLKHGIEQSLGERIEAIAVFNIGDSTWDIELNEAMRIIKAGAAAKFDHLDAEFDAVLSRVYSTPGDIQERSERFWPFIVCLTNVLHDLYNLCPEGHFEAILRIPDSVRESVPVVPDTITPTMAARFTPLGSDGDADHER
jgi:hypothetical protein